MPKPSQSGKKRFFYNQNLKRDKSGKKYKNLIDHTITLIKRLEKEGMTKWMANALNRSQAKIKSYGITLAQMVSALEHKGLTALQNLLDSNLIFVQKKGHNVSISTKRDVLPTVKKIVTSGANIKAKTKLATADKKPGTDKKITPKKATPVKKAATPKKAPAKKPVAEKKVVAKKTVEKKATPVKKAATPKKAPAKKPTTKKSA